MLIKNNLILFLFCLSLFLSGQSKEIGLFLGYSNLVSDVGNNSPISPLENGEFPLQPAVGIFYKQVLNPRMLLKYSFNYAKLDAIDANSPRIDRQKREFESDNQIYEGAVTFEYNFFDIYNGVYKSTPYIFAGFGGFTFREAEYVINYSRSTPSLPPTSATDYKTTPTIKKFNSVNMMIPFGVGYKFRLKEKFMLAVEFTARTTWTDNLDSSKPKRVNQIINDGLTLDPAWGPLIEQNINEDLKRYKTGNTSNLDWYTFTGVSFSYLFGEPPCYCK